jgi:hypothetical protein
MANLILVDEMLAELLDEQTGKSSAHAYDGAKVMLFKNNPTLSTSTVKADLTEADFAGYAQITLAAATFAAASVASHLASTTYGSTLTWTRSTTGTAQTVYGMAVLNSAGTKIICVGNFDGGPYTVTNSGDAISETLTLRRSSEF